MLRARSHGHTAYLVMDRLVVRKNNANPGSSRSPNTQKQDRTACDVQTNEGTHEVFTNEEQETV